MRKEGDREGGEGKVIGERKNKKQTQKASSKLKHAE